MIKTNENKKMFLEVHLLSIELKLDFSCNMAFKICTNTEESQTDYFLFEKNTKKINKNLKTSFIQENNNKFGIIVILLINNQKKSAGNFQVYFEDKEPDVFYKDFFKLENSPEKNSKVFIKWKYSFQQNEKKNFLEEKKSLNFLNIEKEKFNESSINIEKENQNIHNIKKTKNQTSIDRVDLNSDNNKIKKNDHQIPSIQNLDNFSLSDFSRDIINFPIIQSQIKSKKKLEPLKLKNLEEIKNSKKTFVTLSSKNKILNNQISYLNFQIDKNEKNKDILFKENKNLKKKIEKLEEKNKLINQEEIVKLINKLKAYEENERNLFENFEKESIQKNSIQNELNELIKDNFELTKENQKLEKKISILKNNNKKTVEKKKSFFKIFSLTKKKKNLKSPKKILKKIKFSEDEFEKTIETINKTNMGKKSVLKIFKNYQFIKKIIKKREIDNIKENTDNFAILKVENESLKNKIKKLENKKNNSKENLNLKKKLEFKEQEIKYLSRKSIQETNILKDELDMIKSRTKSLNIFENKYEKYLILENSYIKAMKKIAQTLILIQDLNLHPSQKNLLMNLLCDNEFY